MPPNLLLVQFNSRLFHHNALEICAGRKQ